MREGRREGGREGGREGEKEGEREEGERKGGREGGVCMREEVCGMQNCSVAMQEGFSFLLNFFLSQQILCLGTERSYLSA